MRRVVIDAPAFLSWFAEGGGGRSLRREYEAGQLAVAVPTSFITDVLAEVVAQGWPRDRAVRLAAALEGIGFDFGDPSREALARWLGKGLVPGLAAYAALAEETERPLVAGDALLRRRAAPLAATLGAGVYTYIRSRPVQILG